MEAAAVFGNQEGQRQGGLATPSAYVTDERGKDARLVSAVASSRPRRTRGLNSTGKNEQQPQQQQQQLLQQQQLQQQLLQQQQPPQPARHIVCDITILGTDREALEKDPPGGSWEAFCGVEGRLSKPETIRIREHP